MSHHDKPAGLGPQVPQPPVAPGHPITSRHGTSRSILLASILAGAGTPLAPPALMTMLLLPAGLTLLAALPAHAQITVSVRVGPPPLPFYAQPTLVGEGYLWLPGYWAWSAEDFDYFWVPGTWALAPQPGLLWTPGWWGYENSAYSWHGGYWADRVGYYGGIDYGYGYSGYGYQGGRWERGHFHYNTSVNNVSGGVTPYTYRSTSFGNHNPNRASFNGGPGGVVARPTPVEVQQQAGRHTGLTSNQQQHERQALTTPAQRQSQNHGAPPVAATPRPSEFTSPGAVKSRGNTSQRPDRQAPAPTPEPARVTTPAPAQQQTRPPAATQPERPERQPAPKVERPPSRQPDGPPVQQQDRTPRQQRDQAQPQQPERAPAAPQKDRTQPQQRDRTQPQQPDRAPPAQQQDRTPPQQRDRTQPQQPDRAPAAQQQDRAPAAQQPRQPDARPEPRDEEPQQRRGGRGQPGEGR